MFACIKNGLISKRTFVYQDNKVIYKSFLRILWREGFISGYSISKKNPKLIKIFLKYNNKKPTITNLKLITKPGRRIYYNIKQIWKIKFYAKLIIFSTSKGLKTLTECKKLKLGGEPFILIL